MGATESTFCLEDIARRSNKDSMANAVTTLQEAESVREESRYTFRWTIRDFDCLAAKDGECFPKVQFKFNLGENMSFEGRLSLCGENCSRRQCRLELQNVSDKYWSVYCELQAFAQTFPTYFTQNETVRYISLYDPHKYNCLLPDSFNVLKCTFAHVTYKQVDKPSSDNI